VVTCVDDHSRFAVAAKVVRRATGRAVCLAFAEACEGAWSRPIRLGPPSVHDQRVALGQNRCTPPVKRAELR
jgi:hypothetical protein